MNPRVLEQTWRQTPAGQVVPNMNFYGLSSFPFCLLLHFFLLLKEGREKETSTDVSSQWRQSWCGGEEVNVEVSHRERGMPLPEGI